MDEYNNNENMNQGQNQNTDQYGSNGNFNSYNNNGSYQQGNDWQNGGYGNSGYNGGNFNGNSGYNGGYSNSGRQPGRRLSKSTTNKMVCGVCAGIAEYFNWDPTIIRIIWIAASIFLGAGFLGLIAYFIVAVIMPEG
ncbi:PspC domain-containing protein [Eisenbergiella sp.]